MRDSYANKQLHICFVVVVVVVVVTASYVPRGIWQHHRTKLK